MCVLKELIAKWKKKNEQKEIDIRTIQKNIERAEQVSSDPNQIVYSLLCTPSCCKIRSYSKDFCTPCF